MSHADDVKLRAACVLVERFARRIGKDVSITFLDRHGSGVTCAPASWSGEAGGKDLYHALKDAERSSDENQQ